MLDFRLPVMSDNIVTCFFGMLDPENVGIAVGISLLSHLSQRPTYIEVGPLMTTRVGEVRSGTAKGQELMI